MSGFPAAKLFDRQFVLFRASGFEASKSIKVITKSRLNIQ